VPAFHMEFARRWQTSNCKILTPLRSATRVGTTFHGSSARAIAENTLSRSGSRSSVRNLAFLSAIQVPAPRT
jgi:hypothetical protein